MDAVLFVCFYWFYVVACGFTVVGLVVLLCFVCFVWDDLVNWYGAALLLFISLPCALIWLVVSCWLCCFCVGLLIVLLCYVVFHWSLVCGLLLYG